MVRFFEIAAYSCLGSVPVLGNTLPPSSTVAVVQYGALGLCALLVFQGFRQQKHNNAVLDRKDAELRDMGHTIIALEKQRSADAQNLTETLKRLTETLAVRPR